MPSANIAHAAVSGGTLEDMADDEIRRPLGRRGRRPARDKVTADPGWQPGDDPDEGTAGVREPRRPKPSGPLSGAGALPEPEPPLAACLPDPRH